MTIKYKGFYIVPDRLLGYSLRDWSGYWCCSKTSVHQIKLAIDQIVIANAKNNPEKLRLVK